MTVQPAQTTPAGEPFAATTQGPALFRPEPDQSGETARLVAEGLVRRLVLDVHVDADAPDVATLRARAVLTVLAEPGRRASPATVPASVVVGFATAVWVHAGGEPQDRVDVVIAPGSSRQRAAHLATHEHRLRAGDVTCIAGLRLTTPGRTAADVARLLPPAAVPAALDRLARHTGLRAVDVLAQLERMPYGRGVARARGLVNAWAAAVASR